MNARTLTVAHQAPGECSYCDERHAAIVDAVVDDLVVGMKVDVERARNYVLSRVWEALRDAGDIDGMGVVNKLMEGPW
ncbi:hypothetical protein [Streptomyces sp. R44]|uniref:Uncharacterized protein n=1 Tax=Streptomyces sp. R44 TaxID=3238633 RepID=A0AB39T7H8_9ACTN